MNSIRKLTENYLDNLKNATSLSNMNNTMKNLLSKYFKINNKNVKREDFINLLYEYREQFNNSKSRIHIKNDKSAVISFDNLKQKIYLDSDNKIKKINLKIESSQSGGIGYSYAVGMNPIAGKPVISSYYNCCRPIFNGSLLQNGGRLNTAYYLDVSGNHLNVLPQYKQYKDVFD